MSLLYIIGNYLGEIEMINPEIQTFLDIGIPVLKPIDVFVDDRGWSYMNLLSDQMDGGQINIATTYPGVTKAWHRHHNQIDCWMHAAGDFKFAVYNEEHHKLYQYVVTDRNPAILYIPKQCWHGFSVLGDKPATLVYYVTNIYNKENPDEDRVSFDYHERFWNIKNDEFSWNTINQ